LGHKVRLGLRDEVDCAHFLPGHPKCGSLHGHTYRVELSVTGEPEGGLLIDFADLKAALWSVLREYDHGSWNDVLAFPSVENICVLLAGRLRAALPFAFTLRVWEGEGKWAEIDAEAPPA
jgi:6-pyruvoyltetrahydropterin/6-carboxytetrahydropterin synthase